VTLGDSDVVSARPGEKPVALQLKDGEVRFTPGNFAHAAVNQSERPFHNITIELLQPSSSVKTCTEGCLSGAGMTRLISSDQWTASLIKLPPGARLEKHTHSMPHLVIPVSDLHLEQQTESSSNVIQRSSGEVGWVPAGVTHTIANHSPQPARYVALEFRTEKQP
jgi:quercetin dioxygenase-like cupin family protein